jgi:hypothetical protein
LVLAAGETKQPAGRVEMGGVRQMRYDRYGKLAAVICAERATVDDEGTLIMEGIKGTVYTEDGREVGISASKGKADIEGTGDAVFEGDIEVSSSDYVARTTRAVWRESDRTVRGDDEIVLEGKGSRIVGSGFVVFTSGNEPVIYRPRGTIQVEKAEDRTSTSSSSLGKERQ